MSKREFDLGRIAKRIQVMTNMFGRRSDIAITFERPTPDSIAKYSEFERRYHHILEGDEYFFIWETNYDEENSLLYVVNVTADSLLTAASELMDFISRKF